MITLPVIRWGKPYESIEKQPVVHFETGETLAVVSQANAGTKSISLSGGVLGTNTVTTASA